MKKSHLLVLLITAIVFTASAQNKNYLSIEAGGGFGNANANIFSAMQSSGFADKDYIDFFIFGWETQFPKKVNDGASFRLRGGHFFKKNSGAEIAYGKTFSGTVKGYDAGTNTYLFYTSDINILYAGMIFSDSVHRAGISFGPALSFYRLTRFVNRTEDQKNTSALPGGLVSAWFNFLNKKIWYWGVRTDLMLSSPVKIQSVSFSDPSGSTAKFKETKAGSVAGSIDFVLGFRFQ